jgi:hypothetical protein
LKKVFLCFKSKFMSSKNNLVMPELFGDAPQVGLADITDESALQTLAHGRQAGSIEAQMATLIAQTILEKDAVRNGDLALTLALAAFLERTLLTTHPFATAPGPLGQLYSADKALMFASGLGTTPILFTREYWALDNLTKAQKGYVQVSTWAASIKHKNIYDQTLPLAQQPDRGALLIGRVHAQSHAQ